MPVNHFNINGLTLQQVFEALQNSIPGYCYDISCFFLNGFRKILDDFAI